MTEITYRILPHVDGWAYRLGDTWSETYPDHDSAKAAALAVAKEQMSPGRDTYIEYETAEGDWITERADGLDRPLTSVEG